MHLPSQDEGHSSPGSILVVRADRLGDVVLTLPTCGLIRRALPAARVGVLVSRYVKALVEHNPLIDAIVWNDDVNGRPRSVASLVRELKLQRFDAAVVARPTPRLAWAIAHAGIPIRVGTGYRWYSGLFNRRVFDHRKTAERHELEYNLRLLAPLGVDVPPDGSVPDYGITVRQEVSAKLDCILQSFGIHEGTTIVLLHPASGGSARDWPPDRFRELGEALAANQGLSVLVTGTVADERIVRKMMKGGSGRMISMVGILDLELLVALIDRASLVVANSTGPLHLAVARGRKVIGLYPPITAMSSRRWGPYTPTASVLVGEGPANCMRCALGQTCQCMQTITVEQVVAEARRLLGIAKS